MDDQQDISAFMASEVKSETKNKKRKLRESAPDDDIKQRARLLCKSQQEWKTVSRYNPVRMQEFIDEHTFNQQTMLHDSVFGFVHDMWALCVDKLFVGDGYIREQIKNDLSLRAAFEHEGQNLVQFMTNRYKIAVLTVVNGCNGKKRQQEAQPVVIEVNGTDCPENTEPAQTVVEPITE
jgi:hypothetical protein